MAIREQKGRQRPFFVYWTNPFSGKRESKSCLTRQEAEKLDAYIKFQLQYERESFRREPNFIEERKNTLETLLFMYLKARKLEFINLEKTLYGIKWIIERYGNMEVGEFNAQLLLKMKEELLALGNKGATVRRKMGVIKAAFGWAFREGIIPAIPPFPPIQCGDFERYMPPTQSEIAAIYNMAPDHLRRVIILGYQFGMRVGQSELLRLVWDDVDLELEIIRVPNAKKGASQSFREIPIQSALMPLFQQWKNEDNKLGINIVVHYKGKAVKSIRTAWNFALKKAGITRHIRPYDLRHGFATDAIAAGVDYGTLASLMGHLSPTMVLKHYQHVRNDQKRKAIEALPTSIQCVQVDVCKQ